MRNINKQAADGALFAGFNDTLRKVMVQETQLFFESQVREDRQIPELLRADYTFLNEQMAHEISWHTARPTVFFPWSEDELGYLIDRCDVQATYEHRRLPRYWPTLPQRFTLVDKKNDRFWVRRK